jgi:hypothetical protein
MATKPTALRPCGETHLPPDAWHPVPPHIAATLHAQPPADGPTVLVLLDRTSTCLAAIGPFTSPDDALAWRSDEPLDPAVDPMLVPLHPTSGASYDGIAR